MCNKHTQRFFESRLGKRTFSICSSVTDACLQEQLELTLPKHSRIENVNHGLMMNTVMVYVKSSFQIVYPALAEYLRRTVIKS